MGAMQGAAIMSTQCAGLGCLLGQVSVDILNTPERFVAVATATVSISGVGAATVCCGWANMGPPDHLGEIMHWVMPMRFLGATLQA